MAGMVNRGISPKEADESRPYRKPLTLFIVKYIFGVQRYSFFRVFIQGLSSNVRDSYNNVANM